jgi:3,2-trans-enoyl-CoA isomerase
MPRVHTRLTVDAATAVAHLVLAREPVNTMDAALWAELAAALDEVEAARAAGGPGAPRALVVSSGLARDVFTAGNDVKELYAPATSAARYKAFWVAQNTFLARLYASPLLTVAAVRGACPAGGCALALACDARVLADLPSGAIGLNEVALGIPVPEYWQALLRRVVGRGLAERMCLFAKMLPPRAALAAGLADAVVPVDKLDAAAVAIAAAGLAFPDGARVEMKRRERRAFADAWTAFAPREADGAWAMLSAPATVAALKGVMDRLAAKKSKL